MHLRADGFLQTLIASFEADRADETLVEIRHAQIVDTDPPFTGRRVHEFIIADIDRYVAQRPSRIEEEKISLGQFVPRNTQSDKGLFKGRPRKIDVEELIKAGNISKKIDKKRLLFLTERAKVSKKLKIIADKIGLSI